MDMTPYQSRRVQVDVTGRCMNCKRAAVPGNMRCQVHIEINRQRSLAWRMKNPTVRAEEKQVYRDQGRCELCPEHRKMAKGKLHCNPCLERFRGYYETRKEEGMCARLGCPKKAGETVHCEEHREEQNSTQRFNNFLNGKNTSLKLPSGFTLGGR